MSPATSEVSACGCCRLPAVQRYLHRAVLHLCQRVGPQGLHHLLHPLHRLHHPHHCHSLHYHCPDLLPASGGGPQVVVALIHVWRLYRSAGLHTFVSVAHLHPGTCALVALASQTYSIITAFGVMRVLRSGFWFSVWFLGLAAQHAGSDESGNKNEATAVMCIDMILAPASTAQRC